MIMTIIQTAREEWRFLYSQKKIFWSALLLPFILAALTGSVFQQKVVTKMSIGVWDQDQSAFSRTLTRFINSSRSFDIRYAPTSLEEGKKLFFEEQISAFIILPKGLSQRIKKGKQGTIKAMISGTNLVTANLALADLRLITETVAGGIKLKILRKGGLSKKAAYATLMPISVEMIRLYNPGLNYQNYLPPGVWMAIIHQLLLLFGALTIFRREHYSFSKNHFYLLGKILPYFLISFIYFELFYRFVFWRFGIEFKGWIPLMMLVSLAFSFCTLSLGLLIGALGTRTGRMIDAVKGVLLIGSPAFLLSGYSWPLFAMPWGIRIFSYTLPLTHFLSAYRKIYQQGLTFSYIAQELFFLLLIGALCLSLSSFFISEKSEPRETI